MRRDIVLTEYVTYCVLYTSTIICNKYVLTSLGFQFPTIFQAWQTFIGLFLMHVVGGFQVKEMVLRDIGPWVPAMILYVGTIVSGSIALSKLPIPMFILGQGCGDVIVLICNENMPSTMAMFSFPVKLAAAIIASWSAIQQSWYVALMWLIAHAVCSGAYRSVSLWYSSPHWPYSNLTIQQRQYLNYFFSTCVLLPSIFLFGHHEKAKSFPYLNANRFYIGSICSGIFGWAVNKLWMRIFYHTTPDSKTHATQLFSKVLILLLSMNIYPYIFSWSIWIGILLNLIADVLQIIDSNLDEEVPVSEEMHDVLVSF